MIRALVGVALLIAMPAHGQAPVTISSKAFEVATIKLTDPNFGGILIQMPGPGMVTFRGFTVTDLIAFAFDVDNRQVLGVPGPLASPRYDIVGRSDLIRSPAAPGARNDVRLMVQALLAERFKLAVHPETRELSIYALRIGRGGHKLRARAEADGGAPMSMLFQGANLPGRNVTVSMLAEGLQKTVLDRPVIDKTGLQGNWDFDLQWRPDASQFRGRGANMPAASDPDRADLFIAIQEQLGLKLESEKGPGTVIVVDWVDGPSEN